MYSYLRTATRINMTAMTNFYIVIVVTVNVTFNNLFASLFRHCYLGKRGFIYIHKKIYKVI